MTSPNATSPLSSSLRPPPITPSKEQFASTAMTTTRAMAAAQKQVRGQRRSPYEIHPSHQGIVSRQEANSDVTKAPARKRVRKSKSSTRDTPGRTKHTLKRILDMPPEVFNEIAHYLLPADLLSLARSNKLFRSIFMSRSSQHLWRNAISNVKGLPPCLHELSEPQYVSLIYSRTCSNCGGRAQRRMDPWLRVRLCPSCRDELVGELPRDDTRIPLLPVSDEILPGKYSAVCYLEKDLEELNRLMKQPELKNIGKLQTWKAQRRRDMKDRNREAEQLLEFLAHMDADRSHELQTLTNQRRAEIEQRLLEKGWTNDDFKCAPQNLSEWSHLIHQPKPLTDRIWNNIYSKLVPLLEANRAYNEEEGRMKRLAKRQRHLHDLFNKIRNSLPPLVEVIAVWPDEDDDNTRASNKPTKDRRTDIDMPFPTTAELLTWPLIKEMVEVDRPVEEMEDVFNQSRDEIEQAISDWRAKVDQDVLETWHREPEESSSSNTGGSKGKRRTGKNSTRQVRGVPMTRTRTRRRSSKGKERASFNYDLTCGTSLPETTIIYRKPDGTTTEDVDELSDDMRLLFRADTLFVPYIRPPFYPDLLPGHYHSFIASDRGVMPSLSRIWDPAELKRDARGSATARAMLELLGIPEATYPQMKAVDQGFVCQRCSYRLPHSWGDIVSHFAIENDRYNLAQEKIKASPGSEFVFHNTHDLSPGTTKPIFTILSPKDAAEVSFQLVLNNKYEVPSTCKVCEQLGVRDSHYSHTFGAQESEMVEHLRDAHDIRTPAFGKHYKEWMGAPRFYDPFEGEEYSDEDEDEDEEGYGLGSESS